MMDLRPREAAAAKPANPAPPANTGFSNSASRGRKDVELDTDAGSCDVDMVEDVDKFCCSCKSRRRCRHEPTCMVQYERYATSSTVCDRLQTE
jgi:hypothetical protein